MQHPNSEKDRHLICADLSLEFMAHQGGTYTREGIGKKSKLSYFPICVLSSPWAKGTHVATAWCIAIEMNVSD